MTCCAAKLGRKCRPHSICLPATPAAVHTMNKTLAHVTIAQMLLPSALETMKSPCSSASWQLTPKPTCPPGPEGWSWRAWQQPHLHRWPGLQGPPQEHDLRWSPSVLHLAPTGAAAAWLPRLPHGHARWTERQRSWRRDLQHKQKPREMMRQGCKTGQQRLWCAMLHGKVMR